MKTIALANQKGGVGKTTTAASLGVGLAQQGKKVLLVDADAQGNLTQMLGWRQPDELSPTLADLMTKTVNEEPIASGEGILHHASGVDLVPANIELSGLEVTLVNIMSRETVLRQYLSTVAPAYDYAIIDCMPSLGMLTINALTAADSVIIPVQGQYLAAKGLEQLMRTIARVKRQINPHLTVDGILLTMMDSRTTLAKEISEQLRRNYGSRVFASEIPRSIRVAEISATGTSMLNNKLTAALAANAITVKNALEAAVKNGGVAMTETDTAGHTSVSNMEQGLYPVVETRVPENVTSTCNPFFVSLPMTTIDGTAWNYDVTVYPKNQTGNPDLEKTVREAKNSSGKNTGTLTDIQKPSCDPPKTSNHQGRDGSPSLGGCPAVCRNRGGLMPAG